MTPADAIISRKQWSPVNKFGRNGVLGAGTEDLWDGNAAWVAPTQARIHSVVSGDAGDDIDAGVGARTIRIWGLTSWVAPEVSEDLDLEGLTPVNTVNAYVVINRMEVIAWGGTSINVGLITATAATDSTVSSQIAASIGQSRTAVYGLPSGRTLHLTQFAATLDGASAALTDIQVVLMANSDPSGQEETNFRQLHRGTVGMDTFQGHFFHGFNPYLPCVGPHLIKIQVTSDIAAAVVNGGFDGYLTVD